MKPSKSLNWVDSLHIRRAPRILVDPDISLVLMWSAKSASAFAVKWFFEQIGLLEEAFMHHSWIHNYRNQVYYQSDRYKNNINQIIDEKYRVVKFVRNPFNRAVSSYIHALKHGQQDTRLSKYLGRSGEEQTDFSFREFIEYLETIDVSSCDIHYRWQIHAVEDHNILHPHFIIKVETAKTKLKDIEVDLGLPTTNPEILNPSTHHTKRYQSKELQANTKLIVHDKRTATFPETASFYNSELCSRVASIYSEDFERYGYSKEFDFR